VNIDYLDWNPPHISYSTIDGYRTCGLRTYLQKVIRIEQRPGLAGLGGNAVHAATEAVDHLIWDQGWSALDSAPAETEAPF
jgi:hypothetical protein